MVSPLTIVASSLNHLHGVRLEEDVLELTLVRDDADGGHLRPSRAAEYRWR
ncbi:MAG: hypothetical protein R2714_07790 [Microthrixaceae bacterium]|nr:hypothetical protein [Microthrixaceae bacterium]